MEDHEISLPAPAVDDERREHQQRTVTAWFDVGLSVLAVVMVILLVIELAAPLSTTWVSRLARVQLAIWGVFVAAFLIELYLAPSKPRYLREHWLVALSLALPLLRIFRVVRALRVLRGARAVRSLTLARVASALNRGTRGLRRFIVVSRFAYLLALTVLVTLVTAAAALYLERGAPQATITDFGEALWWAATVVSTVNSPLETVTPEGRVVALALRIFGVAVIGYLTARIAVFLLGEQIGTRPGETDATADVRALRQEIAQLRKLLEDRAEHSDGVAPADEMSAGPLRDR